ncbi:deadenylation-dependent decapping of nuclear-transcribed mRNA [Mactra antiquata]
MADTCFADYSSLGQGDPSSYDNELSEVPVEEGEYDVLNDETFGDFVEDDFDWEQQTEKFAEEFDPVHAHPHNDSGFNTAEKTYKTQEEYMEHSISQLVVDDDDNDPAVLRSKPIPKRKQNLDSLFGPASPPSLLDTEQLVSPTSKNIWGSPLTEVIHPHQPQHVDNIQSLFDFAKSVNADTPVARIHGPHSRQAPVMLPKAQTLEEIENSLLRKPKVLTAEELERQLRGETITRPVNIPNGHPGHPSQFTVPPPNMSSMPPRPLPSQMGQSPNMKGVINGHRSPIFGAQPPIGTPPRLPPGILSLGQSSPLPIGTNPPYRNASNTPNRQSPVLMLARRSPVPRSPTPPPVGSSPQSPLYPGVLFRSMAPYSSPNQPRYIATPGRGYSQPIGIPRAMRGPPPTNSPGQGMYGSPQGHYQSPQQRMQHQGSFDSNMNRNNNIKNQTSPYVKPVYQQNERNMNENNANNNREHRYHRYPYNQKYESKHEHSGHSKRGSKDEDIYDGLMTQKEKDWIIKIQLLQLQTDNPYLDDYYYTSWCMKKKAKERDKNSDEKSDSRLVVPALARYENKTYKPAHFEGSLGRLTTSSVHNPRQIIDLLAKSVSETAGVGNKTTTNVGKELRKSRQLFMDIEKGYNVLLYIDDLEKQILALPEDMRKPLLEERSYRIDLLFHYLLCDGNSAAFMQYMNVRKGRSLTKRALPYLDKVQSVGIVSLVCKNLQQLMKNDQADERLEELFGPCAQVIETCNLATVVMFIEDIQHEESPSTTKPIAMALQNKFGCSMLCTLLHRGEEIYETTSAVDLDTNLQNEWSEFVHDFAGILATVPLESIMPPLQTYSNIEKHLERLLNKRLMAVVEDSLKVFTVSPTANES